MFFSWKGNHGLVNMVACLQVYNWKQTCGFKTLLFKTKTQGSQDRDSGLKTKIKNKTEYVRGQKSKDANVKKNRK